MKRKEKKRMNAILFPFLFWEVWFLMLITSPIEPLQISFPWKRIDYYVEFSPLASSLAIESGIFGNVPKGSILKQELKASAIKREEKNFNSQKLVRISNELPLDF